MPWTSWSTQLIMEGTSGLRLIGAYCPRVSCRYRLGEAPRAGRTVASPGARPSRNNPSSG
jgi:hypothetical protein